MMVLMTLALVMFMVTPGSFLGKAWNSLNALNEINMDMDEFGEGAVESYELIDIFKIAVLGNTIQIQKSPF